MPRRNRRGQLLMNDDGNPKSKNENPSATASLELDRESLLKAIGGSASYSANRILADQTIEALRLKGLGKERSHEVKTAAMQSLIGIAPQDEIEGLLAAQILACHNAAMECYRRAMIADQTWDGWCDSLAQANKLSRTLCDLVQALNKHRGKSQQKVTVEHVHVHEGGQAIVGTVEGARGATPKK